MLQIAFYFCLSKALFCYQIKLVLTYFKQLVPHQPQASEYVTDGRPRRADVELLQRPRLGPRSDLAPEYEFKWLE